MTRDETRTPGNKDAITYELDIAREISTDFLEETHGALYQARIQQLARDFKEDGYDLSLSYAFGPGTVSLIISAPYPETLHALSAAAEALGHELPEPEARLGHTPDELDALRTRQGCENVAQENLHVEHVVTVGLSHRLAGAIADLMRGSLISSAARNDLKIFASQLAEDAHRRVRIANQAPQATVPYERWVVAAATELARRVQLTPSEAEDILLEQLVSYKAPDSHLDGYPACLSLPAFGSLELETRDLIHSLYDAAWNKSNCIAAEIFRSAEPEGEPYVIGLYGAPKRRLAFYDHPAVTDLACSTPEDLYRLHAAITTAIATTAAEYD